MLNAVDYLVQFPHLDRPSLDNHKHARKLLLAVEGSQRRLISDGYQIVGVSQSKMPDCRVAAEFHGSYGFLRLCGQLVCSFSDGTFHSSNRKPKLVELEEVLVESRLDPVRSDNLFKIATAIVANANAREFGCTLVLDLNAQPIEISGQKVEHPLDLELPHHLDLAESLAHLDGALHIGADLHLHGFGCLLDGRAIPSEDRARGARFNSALRFSAEHQEIIIVVVSSDRRVSVIQGGIELTAQCQWLSFSEFVKPPPTIDEWLKRSG